VSIDFVSWFSVRSRPKALAPVIFLNDSNVPETAYFLLIVNDCLLENTSNLLSDPSVRG
jgi:hypothetical protein